MGSYDWHYMLVVLYESERIFMTLLSMIHAEMKGQKMKKD
jgi:hypothetical protein